MINKNELIEISKLMGLKPWQQEKHYIQYMVLNSIADMPIIFKGGTYLWFAHGLNRFSEDLDFTASGGIKNNIANIVSRNLDLFGVENTIKVIADNDITNSFRISAKGPLNTGKIDECVVYVEISKRESILKDTIAVKLDYPAYSLPIKIIAGMALGEVGAEKVRAILTRQKARDIYDLYYLISKKNIRFDEPAVNLKLNYYKMVFSKTKFIERINVMQNTYVKELNGLIYGELPKFTDVIKCIQKWIK